MRVVFGFLTLLTLIFHLTFAVELKVYSIVKGKVVKVYVSEGQRVKKGQLLIEIDPSLYLAEKERLLGKKKEIEARLWKVGRDYERLRELFERDLLAETVFENKKVEYDTLMAQLQQVEGEIKRVDTLISYTRIVAPSDGRVVRILTPEGSYTNGELQPQPVLILRPLGK